MVTIVFFIRCSLLQFNRVNNKEHQRSLVVSSFCICACVGILFVLHLKQSFVGFECELAVLFEVVPHHLGSFPFPAWGLLAGLPGFASHGSSLHLGAGCQ